MLLTKREEQLLKAFQEYGKLSINQMTDILQVSKRTTYRTIADLTESLDTIQVSILKESGKYYLHGQLDRLTTFESQESFSREERLSWICLMLLLEDEGLTNEALQTTFLVSNVTIIQDVAQIEERLQQFDLILNRQHKGYQLVGDAGTKRWLAAVILTDVYAVADFKRLADVTFPHFDVAQFQVAQQVFQEEVENIPECDTKMGHFLIALLSLANVNTLETKTYAISRMAMDITQSLFRSYAKLIGRFYSLQEILYFASRLDEFVIKRQPVPLFQEQVDSEFYYNISNLIDKVSLYTKINFAKDQVLFKFLFNHVRLSLAVPEMFRETSNPAVTHHALKQSSYLHRVITLLIKDIFPPYLQTQNEFELITLHFASSLKRSPDIYPVRLLLLTDERPLARELLMTRIRHLAPFIERLTVKSLSQYETLDDRLYDAILTTRPSTEGHYYIPIFPDGKALLELQDYLQDVQENRDIVMREALPEESSYDSQEYLRAAHELLSTFSLFQVDNAKHFDQSVATIVAQLPGISDTNYLTQKLIQRFHQSPMAIPDTGLMLLHTQSHTVETSGFYICDLTKTISAVSMNQQTENVSRVLIMLTKTSENDSVRDLMTAIGQSIIENHLYTEIYKTGNKAIIYQLLNQIFTNKIKQLEN